VNITFFGSVLWSFRALDISFLLALAVCMVSLFLLSGPRTWLSALNALWIGSGLLVELTVMVYLFTPTYIGHQFADAAPVWFTNQALGIGSAFSLFLITTAEVRLRRLRSYRPHRTAHVESPSALAE